MNKDRSFMDLRKPIEFPRLHVDELTVDQFLSSPIHNDLCSLIQYRYELLLCELQEPDGPIERVRYLQGVARGLAELIDILSTNWRRNWEEMRQRIEGRMKQDGNITIEDES